MWTKGRKKEPTSKQEMGREGKGDGPGLLPLPSSSLVDLPELCDSPGEPECLRPHSHGSSSHDLCSFSLCILSVLNSVNIICICLVWLAGGQ